MVQSKMAALITSFFWNHPFGFFLLRREIKEYAINLSLIAISNALSLLRTCHVSEGVKGVKRDLQIRWFKSVNRNDPSNISLVALNLAS